MSFRSSPVRLRRQLILLALLALLPVLAFALYGAVGQRRQTTGRMEREASRLLQVALAQHDALLASTASRLEGLALAPETRFEPHVGCDTLLHAVDARWPGVADIGLFDPDGRRHCSSEPPTPYAARSSARTAAFVGRVIAMPRFTIGRAFYDDESGVPAVVVGQPVEGRDGRVTEVLMAAAVLRWIEHFPRDVALPAHATVVLLDGAGRVLYRAPRPERWTGQVATDSTLLRLVRSATTPAFDSSSRVVEGAGLDGESRVYAVGRLPGPGDAAPYLTVGLSKARAVADADAILRRDLLRVGGLTLLTLVVAAIVGELLVLRRVRALVEATERIAGGRLDLGTGVPHDAGEVGRIAEAVDRMTAALRTRAAEADEAVAALRRGEERYRSLVVGTSQIVWSADRTGAVVEDVPSWRAVTGQTPEESRGFGWFAAVHPDDRAAARDALRTAGVERRQLSTLWRLRTASGEYRHYTVHGVPLFEADGRTVREWVGFGVDVTEQRTAEEALRQSEDAQRQGQKLEAVGRLAGGIAHDFNNLLTAIRSYSELVLEDQALGEQHRGDVEEIQKATDRAAALVRQLLAFSRRQPVQPALLDVDAVVRDMDALLRRLIGAEYVLAAEAGAPGARVRADRAQLEQVLLNLVLNARDAMPDGGTITVTTASRDDEEGGVRVPSVELSVRDTGVGMDGTTRARIFEPFFTTKAPGVGTGLGLATVYGAVQQAGGRIEVESAPGAGTVFRVILPRAADGASLPTPPLGAPAVRPEQPLASRGVVLLADDEAALRSAAARVLRRAGYTVLEAEDGEAALALWRESRDAIALLLTDVRMPRLNGVELAERLRSEAPELPVLFMTGYAAELAARAERTVPDARHMEKPFEVRALVDMVDDALRRPARRP